MYGFEGICLSEVQLSISELSIVGGWWWVGGGWTGQTHFMVGPGRGPTKRQTKRINMKQMEEIEFSLHPICVVGEIKSGRAPIKSEHKNLEHSQTSHKPVKIQRK